VLVTPSAAKPLSNVMAKTDVDTIDDVVFTGQTTRDVTKFPPDSESVPNVPLSLVPARTVHPLTEDAPPDLPATLAVVT
jgi:hypothetical protein